MGLNRIPIGPEPPEAIYVVVEIARGGEPVKYEIDKVSGAVFVVAGDVRVGNRRAGERMSVRGPADRAADPLRGAVRIVAVLNLGYFGIEVRRRGRDRVGLPVRGQRSISWKMSSVNLADRCRAGLERRGTARGLGMALAGFCSSPGIATIWTGLGRSSRAPVGAGADTALR